MRPICWLVLSALLFPAACFGQAARSASGKAATGTISGHVYCGDTNGPARLARVTLEQASDLDRYKPSPDRNSPAPGNVIQIIQTGLDGSFYVPGVKPGSYYVLAEKLGYLSPMARFTQDELDEVSAETKKELVRSLTKVTVEADQTATAEVRLERGAAISGVVTFDDGTQAIGVNMQLLKRNKNGKWQPLRLASLGNNMTSTDDQGAYRIAGLPAGEYVASAVLRIEDVRVSNFLGNASASWADKFSLPIYSGSVFRAADAVAFKLGFGEDRSGEDLTIPLSKLHPVTGALVAAHDGHTLTGGKVTIRSADGKDEIGHTEVDSKTAEFHFEFIPEGEYVVKVDGAEDASYREVSTVWVSGRRRASNIPR